MRLKSSEPRHGDRATWIGALTNHHHHPTRATLRAAARGPATGLRLWHLDSGKEAQEKLWGA